MSNVSSPKVVRIMEMAFDSGKDREVSDTLFAEVARDVLSAVLGFDHKDKLGVVESTVDDRERLIVAATLLIAEVERRDRIRREEVKAAREANPQLKCWSGRVSGAAQVGYRVVATSQSEAAIQLCKVLGMRSEKTKAIESDIKSGFGEGWPKDMDLIMPEVGVWSFTNSGVSTVVQRLL